MHRLPVMTLLALLLCTAAMADSLTWTVPDGLTALNLTDTPDVAETLNTDPDTLAEDLRESGTVLLLTDAAGTLIQLTEGTAAVSGLDFDTMGRKKVNILAEQLAGNDRTAAVLQLRFENPLPSTTMHRCGWWILLAPTESAWPRTLTILTACRGTELTMYITAPTGEAENDALEQAQLLAASLILTQE